MADDARSRWHARGSVVRVCQRRDRLLLSERPRPPLGRQERGSGPHGEDDPACGRARLPAVRFPPGRRGVQAAVDRVRVRDPRAGGLSAALAWPMASPPRSGRSATRPVAHLHPWNTPPLDEPFVPRNSMLANLPARLQLAKVERLTDTLRRAFDAAPVSFRAGRYALGPETVAALIRCGYRVDSSVTPYVSWEGFDDGPSFVGAPLGPYRLGG